MKTNRELWTIASTLMQDHGDDAPIIVAVRLGELSAAGDHDGAVAWVGVLQRMARMMVGTGDGSA